MKRLLIFAFLILSGVPLSGCGGTTRVVQNNETCGKQMTDLQTALNTGAMTQSEYDHARREAIKRCDKS
ncbi:hypothetical protein [Dyella sp. 20L07]|uniref:hypothetical protein n=1 Tax=Dyella sp. 20L07 TaxID=3384240 RepID=UPI003D2BC671